MRNNCPSCKGSGAWMVPLAGSAGVMLRKCWACRGRGFVDSPESLLDSERSPSAVKSAVVKIAVAALVLLPIWVASGVFV